MMTIGTVIWLGWKDEFSLCSDKIHEITNLRSTKLELVIMMMKKMMMKKAGHALDRLPTYQEKKPK